MSFKTLIILRQLLVKIPLIPIGKSLFMLTMLVTQHHDGGMCRDIVYDSMLNKTAFVLLSISDSLFSSCIERPLLKLFLIHNKSLAAWVPLLIEKYSGHYFLNISGTVHIIVVYQMLSIFTKYGWLMCGLLFLHLSTSLGCFCPRTFVFKNRLD